MKIFTIEFEGGESDAGNLLAYQFGQACQSGIIALLKKSNYLFKEPYCDAIERETKLYICRQRHYQTGQHQGNFKILGNGCLVKNFLSFLFI